MALADTLSATIVANLNAKIATTEGGLAGENNARHKVTKSLADGASSGQATGFFSSSFTATTGGITISMADSADPLGAAGDDTPTSDPEGLKLRTLLIENQDATNFCTIKRGANGEASMLNGATDGIVISPGGMLLWHSPAGVNAMNDGADDEMLFTADTASVVIKVSYIYG